MALNSDNQIQLSNQNTYNKKKIELHHTYLNNEQSSTRRSKAKQVVKQTPPRTPRLLKYAQVEK